MKKSISLPYYSNNQRTIEDIQLSPVCPLCKVSLIPQVISGIILDHEDEEDNVVFLLNYCPNCRECFISRHIIDINGQGGYLFDSAAPQKPTPNKFPHFIKEISPNFLEVFDQSSAAEAYGLNQIAGVGYRKALEFLIKDYLISQTDDPKVINGIKTKFLGKCISEDIENPQLKTVASRAAWLGNDQTHYEQIFEDRDISDLKRLIRLTVHWISLLKETEEAESIHPRK